MKLVLLHFEALHDRSFTLAMYVLVIDISIYIYKACCLNQCSLAAGDLTLYSIQVLCIEVNFLSRN